MKYLLDVNALLACEHAGSPHHDKFHAWAGREGLLNMVTCAQSELGFLRVSMQVFGYSLAQAQSALAGMRSRLGGFVDHAPSPRLAAWASTAAKTSDAYLVQVAKNAGLRFATFDRGIKDPAAIVIR